MKFKAAAREEKPAEWQEEVAVKKGKEFLEQAKEKKEVKQELPVTPVAAELAGGSHSFTPTWSHSCRIPHFPA